MFGAALHLAGLDRVALEQATKSLDGGLGLVWHEVAPQLEDVFIHLLTRSAKVAS